MQKETERAKSVCLMYSEPPVVELQAWQSPHRRKRWSSQRQKNGAASQWKSAEASPKSGNSRMRRFFLLVISRFLVLGAPPIWMYSESWPSQLFYLMRRFRRIQLSGRRTGIEQMSGTPHSFYVGFPERNSKVNIVKHKKERQKKNRRKCQNKGMNN